MPEILQSHVTFGVITDVQYCDCEPLYNRHYRKSLQKLEDCVGTLNKMNLDFVMHLGDLIDHDFASFGPALKAIGRLTFPVYHLPGNHDYAVDDQFKPLVADQFGLLGTHYEFRYANWRFITLDGNEISLLVDAEGSKTHRAASEMLAGMESRGVDNARYWNGAAGPSQIVQMESKLRVAEDMGEQVILFCHYPVHPSHTHNLWNDLEVVDVIGRHPCVRAFINGHQHQGAYALHHGVHYLTMRGMVETENETAFSVVRIFNNRIEVEGFGREENRVLRLGPGHPVIQ